MNLQFFRTDQLRPGDIVHSYTKGFYANAIRRILGSKGSHDAIIVQQGKALMIGEALATAGATLTNLSTYEKRMAKGETAVAIYRMPHAAATDGQAAAHWFSTYILGSGYDFRAILQIFFKATFRGVSKSVAGHEFRWYCTESVRDAWTIPPMTADFDIWDKVYPTPGTTEKRVAAGALLDVSADCLTDAGLKHYLKI